MWWSVPTQRPVLASTGPDLRALVTDVELGGDLSGVEHYAHPAIESRRRPRAHARQLGYRPTFRDSETRIKLRPRSHLPRLPALKVLFSPGQNVVALLLCQLAQRRMLSQDRHDFPQLLFHIVVPFFVPFAQEPCGLLKSSSCFASSASLHFPCRPLRATSAQVTAALAPYPVGPRRLSKLRRGLPNLRQDPPGRSELLG